MGGNFIRLSFTGQSQSLKQWDLRSSQAYIVHIIYDGSKNEIFPQRERMCVWVWLQFYYRNSSENSIIRWGGLCGGIIMWCTYIILLLLKLKGFYMYQLRMFLAQYLSAIIYVCIYKGAPTAGQADRESQMLILTALPNELAVLFAFGRGLYFGTCAGMCLHHWLCDPIYMCMCVLLCVCVCACVCVCVWVSMHACTMHNMDIRSNWCDAAVPY